MTKLVDIEGIGPVYAAKLQEAGVGSAEALLDQGATPKGRKEIAEKSGISDGLILEWVNHADLFRVKGVGGQFSDLLEEAGVDTIPELASRKADALTAKMREVNETKNLVNRLPSKDQVAEWIAAAKKMKRVVEY